jgi:hypothetical protein
MNYSQGVKVVKKPPSLQEPTTMDYKKAIDLVFKLSSTEDTDGWRYTVEIVASDPRNAKIAVFDENNIKMGYL